MKKIELSGINFNNAEITKTTTMTNKQNDMTVTFFLVDDIDDDNYKILFIAYPI